MKRTAQKVLIVNKETVYADFLRANIEREFPTVTISVAASGESALSLINKRTYDLVITDTSLPGMGGVNLFFELKGRHPELKTILLSESFKTKEMRLLQKEGLYGYIEKPFLMESLAELIERALRGQRGT